MGDFFRFICESTEGRVFQMLDRSWTLLLPRKEKRKEGKGSLTRGITVNLGFTVPELCICRYIIPWDVSDDCAYLDFHRDLKIDEQVHAVFTSLTAAEPKSSMHSRDSCIYNLKSPT